MIATTGSAGPGKAPFRHIDDLTSVRVALDPYTPLHKVLETGRDHLSRAIALNTWNRPDLALQEYIQAFTIAVDTIPKHKEYPSLKADRSGLGRLYSTLKSDITRHGQTFDRVKEVVKEDNKKTGILPHNGLPSVPSTQPRIDAEPAALSPQKSKPSVHPKPQELHGTASNSVDDLASRFARLRDSRDTAATNGQSKPTGPRDMPASHRPKPSIDSSVPRMPKLPDAIYSPARGTISSELANLPSSTPRGMFSRTNSIPSAPSTSARTSVENAIKHFSGEQPADSTASPQPKEISIPKGETITPEQLRGYQRQGSSKIQILVIDVRDRQSFDEGHIMSQRTICVEPEILTRENISSEDIADSMVLAPPKEKLAFEHRDKADMVVVYDQQSKNVPRMMTSSLQEVVLYNLMQALTHYSFSKPLKHQPFLLRGGLDAWVDELGVMSLETSQTAPSEAAGTIHNRNKRRARTETRTLDKREIAEFEATIKQDQEAASPVDSVARTTEDFFRRFPPVATTKESMTSVTNPTARTPRVKDHVGYDYRDAAPAPPTRPAPTRPKTHYSGFDTRPSETGAGGASNRMLNSSRPLTGLENPANWCYGNSVIQALLASPGFTAELIKKEWPDTWRPPGLTREKAPQLMARILGNLFQWLIKREFKVMRASTLMKYANSIHQGSLDVNEKLTHFGDSNQHDADEFITFVLDQLHEESKIHRDGRNPVHFDKEPFQVNRPITMTDLVNFWESYLRVEYSLCSRNWAFIYTAKLTCKRCHQEHYRPNVEFFHPLQVEKQRLTACLEDEFGDGPRFQEFTCERCKVLQSHMPVANKLTRMPPLLRMNIARSLGSAKKTDSFEFPFRDLDLSPYELFNRASDYNGSLFSNFDDRGGGFKESTKYDLYAVIVHKGVSVKSGHYLCWVNQGNDQWVLCNDHHITTETNINALKQRLFQCKGGETPYLLFYKRQDIQWD